MHSNIVSNNINRQPNYAQNYGSQQQRGAQQKPVFIQKGQNAGNSYLTQQPGENRPLQFAQARNHPGNANQMFFASHNPIIGGANNNTGQSTGQFGAGQMSSMANSNGKGSITPNTLLSNKISDVAGQGVEPSYEQQQQELRQRLFQQNNITGMPNIKGQHPNAGQGRQLSQQRSQNGSQGPPKNRQQQPSSYQGLQKPTLKFNSNIPRQHSNTGRQYSQNAKQRGVDGGQGGTASKQHSKTLRATIPQKQQPSILNPRGYRTQASRERAEVEQFQTLPQNSLNSGLKSQAQKQNSNFQTIQIARSDSRDDLERLTEIQRYTTEHQNVLLKKQQSAGAPEFKGAEQSNMNFAVAQGLMPGSTSSQSLGGNLGAAEYDLPLQILQGKLMAQNEPAFAGQQMPQPSNQEANQLQKLIEQQRLQQLLQQQNADDQVGIKANFIDFYNQFQAQQPYSPQQLTPQADQLADQQSPGSDESDEALQRMILGLKQDVNECKLLFEKRVSANQDGSGSSPRRPQTFSQEPSSTQEPAQKASSGKSSKVALSAAKASPQYSKPTGKVKPAPVIQVPTETDELIQKPAKREIIDQPLNQRDLHSNVQATDTNRRSGSWLGPDASNKNPRNQGPHEGLEQFQARQSLPSASEQAQVMEGVLNSNIPQEDFVNLNITDKALGEDSDGSKENQRIFQFSPLSSKKEPFGGDSESESERVAGSSNEHPLREDSDMNGASSAPDIAEEPQRHRTNYAVEERKMRSDGQEAHQILVTNEQNWEFQNFQNDLNLSEQPSTGKPETMLSINALQKQPMTVQQQARISGQLLQTELQSLQEVAVAHKREEVPQIVQQTHSLAVSPNTLLVQPQMSGANITSFDQLNETTLQQNVQPEKVKIVYMEKKVDKSDQNVQTTAQTEDKKPSTALVSRLVQTEEEKKSEREVRNLSPFETYDLLFIRDLVNNLNYDNEVLNDNSADLKTAFMFLFNEHKQLQFQYQKERRNQKLIALYRKRLEEVGKEKDDAVQIGMKLKTKIEMMTDIMRITVEESQAQQKEQDQLIDELMEENKHLRSLLGIHRENQEPKAIEEGLQEQAEIEKLVEAKPKDDSIESEIHNQLLTYEQELIRDQEDFLISLREEHEHQFKQELTKQDAQFNREIDEHKEAIERIYDEKLQERSEEIEQELRETLTEDITTDLTATLTDQLTQSITKQVEAKVKEDMAQGEKKQSAKMETKTDMKTEILKELQEDIQSGRSSELLLQITALVETQMQSTHSTQKDNFEKMQALKLLNQKSSESENNKTQDLQALMMESAYQKDLEEEKKGQGEYDEIDSKDDLLDMLNYEEQDKKAMREQMKESSTEKQTPKQLQLNDNEEFMADEQTMSKHSKFMSEKSKFKQELMMSNTIPYGKKKNTSQRYEELNQSPPNFKTMKEKEISSVPRSQKSKNLTGSSGQSASDDLSDDNLPGNQFDYQQIFENQVMDEDEEELLNQLKAQEQNNEIKDEEMQKQDELENYVQQYAGISNSYEEEEGDSQGSPDRDEQIQQIFNSQDNQDQDFQRDPNWIANQFNQDDNQVNPDEQLTPRRNRDAQGARTRGHRETRNHNQFQGFQGQTIRQVQQQQQRDQEEGENDYAQTQGLQRGSQGSGSSPDQVQDRDQAIYSGDLADSSQTGRQNSVQPFFTSSQNSSEQRRRGQGFQGQELSGITRNQGLFQTDELGSIEPIRSDDQIEEIDDEYDDFFQGLQQEMQGDGQISSQQPSPSSLIEPNTQDTFGDQLGQEMGQPSDPENSLERNLEKFLQDEEATDHDKGENLLDSTKGMSKMARLMDQDKKRDEELKEDHLAEDRDADKEEVYDYFLDAHKDENANENKGYHIIDANDLGESEGGTKKQEEPDEDDLEQIEDDELRDYRYKNMLEDLKDKIEEEEQENQIISDKRASK